MTSYRAIWLCYWTLSLSAALGFGAIYLAQAPTNPKGVTALACISVWLAFTAIAGIITYAAARDAE